MGLYDLYEVRGGKESAWGTAVAQTAKRMGITDIELRSLIENRLLEDKRGHLAPAHLAAQVKDGGEGTMGGWLFYEDAPFIFDGIEIATPAGVGPYTYDYASPGTAATSPRFETLAYGDGTDIWSLKGALMRTFSIQGATGEPLTYSQEFIGKSMSSDTFDSDAEADRTATPVMGHQVAIYIDPSTDAAGTTQISNMGFTFALNYITNRELRYHLGSLQPNNWQDRKHEGTLELMLEVSDTTTPFLDSILNQAGTPFERVVRVAATYDSMICRFDFNGVIENAPSVIEDRDGIATYNLVLKGIYNSTLGGFFKAHVQNEVSALP